MTVSLSRNTLTSRWITELTNQVARGRHILLYGNVHDQFLWRGTYYGVSECVRTWLSERGFDLVVQYDPVDGLAFDTPDQRFRFDQLWRGALGGSTPAPPPTSPPSPPPNGAGAAPPPRGLPLANAPADSRAQAMTPGDAFPRLRAAMRQDKTSIATIIDISDLLTTDPSRYDEAERVVVGFLKKWTIEAAMLDQGPLAGVRNTLVIIASELGRVPEWIHRGNPFVGVVNVGMPSKDERRAFAAAFLRSNGASDGFHGGEAVADGKAFEKVCDDLADLTDGMRTWDLEALRRTSRIERISIAETRRLVDFFRFGLRDDPWLQLNREKIADANNLLSTKVIGQQFAVEAVTSMLTSARVGVSMSASPGQGGRPRGVFFFVGPTGVGKTELAKALTELVFGDEKAFERFDMSEYKEEHAAEKLAGSPPGFVGYEEGGRLTNRVMERPHSILLFDEIEKAHPRVLDKFLQILEDGRLTDGKGQTAYFNQTAIIFTSNIGASDSDGRPGIMQRVMAGNVDAITYAEVVRHFMDEVRWYFASKIGRAELLNRFGDNIVVFDVLRPSHVEAIAHKFTRLLAASARERLGVTLVFDESVYERVRSNMALGDNLLYGGRRVKSLLETMVERPFNRWVFDQGDASLAGQRLRLSLLAEENDRLEVTRDV